MFTRKTAVIGLGAVCLVGSACAQSTPRELRDARQAYQRAANGPAAQLNPAQLHEAERQLELAERAFDDKGDSATTRDAAYVAMRKAQIAEVQARTVQAEQEEQRWQQQAAAAQQQAYQQQRQQVAQTQEELERMQAQLQEEQQRRAQAEQQAQQASAELARIANVKQDERGTVITLPGAVLFQSGKAKLMSSAEGKLGQVASALAKAPDAQIIVEGHTDSQGSEAFNDKLSEQRAEAVRDYLVDQGLPAANIRTEGRGESQPVADNDTPEGRANNRRVEIVVQQPGQQGMQGQQGMHHEHMGAPSSATQSSPGSTPERSELRKRGSSSSSQSTPSSANQLPDANRPGANSGSTSGSR